MAFQEYIDSDGIAAVIALSEILALKAKYEIELNTYDQEDKEKLFGLVEKLDVKNILSENEYKYLKQNLDEINSYYK